MEMESPQTQEALNSIPAVSPRTPVKFRHATDDGRDYSALHLSLLCIHGIT